MLLIVGLFKDATTTEFTFFSNPESEKANQLIEERLRGPQGVNDVVIVRYANGTVDSPELQGYVLGLYDEIMGLGSEIVTGGVNYYQTGDETLVSNQRDSTLIPLVVAGEFKDAESNIGKVRHVMESVPAPSGAEVLHDRNGVVRQRLHGIHSERPHEGRGDRDALRHVDTGRGIRDPGRGRSTHGPGGRRHWR